MSPAQRFGVFGAWLTLALVAHWGFTDPHMQEPNRGTVTIYGAAFWSLRVRM
jgi:hypothetical protein